MLLGMVMRMVAMVSELNSGLEEEARQKTRRVWRGEKWHLSRRKAGNPRGLSPLLRALTGLPMFTMVYNS